jgi:hypothetical protein
MAGKDKQGREVRKPKASKKAKGVTAAPSSAIPSTSTHQREHPAK